MAEQQKCLKCKTPLGRSSELRICSCCKSVYLVDNVDGAESIRMLNKSVYFRGCVCPNAILYFLLPLFFLIFTQGKFYIDGDDVVFISSSGGMPRRFKTHNFVDNHWFGGLCKVTDLSNNRFVVVFNGRNIRKKISALLTTNINNKK